MGHAGQQWIVAEAADRGGAIDGEYLSCATRSSKITSFNMTLRTTLPIIDAPSSILVLDLLVRLNARWQPAPQHSLHAATYGILRSSAAGIGMTSGEPTSAKVLLLLVRHIEASFRAALRQRFDVVLDFFASDEPLPAFLAAAASAPEPPRAAVVMGASPARVDAALLDAVPSLRCLVSLAAGVDSIDLDECARRSVVVANSGRVFSTDVADHAVGMLIDVLRRVSAAQRFVRSGLWPVQRDYPLGSKLGGRRVGIIGLGNIGSLIAKRLEALGCVIYYNSNAQGFSLLQILPQCP
ncbi:hypothetical protein BS78_06G006200 [Paspalum vaginatum]|nr:hypothetical protein BS78_06G006200 [Paspalum vaginatum]